MTDSNLQSNVGHSSRSTDRAYSASDHEALGLHDRADSILLQCKQSRPLSAIESAIALLRDVLESQTLPQQLRSNALRELANALLIRFNQSGWVQDVEEAIQLVNAAGINPESHTADGGVEDQSVEIEEYGRKIKLAGTSLVEFCQSVEASTLDRAIVLLRQALPLWSEAHPKRLVSIRSLSTALVLKYHLVKESRDLDDAIKLHQQALHLLPYPHPDRFQYLFSLSALHCIRATQENQNQEFLEATRWRNTASDEDKEAEAFCSRGIGMMEVTTQALDLNAAVSYLRKSLELRPFPHPRRFLTINNLAIALSRRFRQTGQLADLEDSIALHRQAQKLDLYPESRSISVINFSGVLNLRFQVTGRLPHLEEAIIFYRQTLVTLTSPHPLRSVMLEKLGRALWLRFSQTDQFPDFQECITCYRQGLGLRPVPHPGRPDLLSVLASMLAIRYDHKGQVVDLEESILFQREALDLFPSTYPDRGQTLNNLANALLSRFLRKGHLPDLEECIIVHRRALDLFPAPHPLRSTSLNNLANALSTRFTELNQVSYLEEAIELHREALKLRPVPHPERFISLDNLASTLIKRDNSYGRATDLTESIAFYRQALELVPPHHTSLPAILDNIGFALAQTGQSSDLLESIGFHRQALEQTPFPHPDRHLSLRNLASSLHRKSEQVPQRHEIEEAIDLYREALSLLPSNHPHQFITRELGLTLVALHSITSQPQHLEDAITAFRSAAKNELSSALDRFRSLLAWTDAADSTHSSALEAYELAINLLPRVSMLSMSLQARREALILSKSNGLACNAASCAIRSGNLEKAVEFLEEGRVVFWSQALRLRTPFDKLLLKAPVLAKKLRDLSDTLEKWSLLDELRTGGDTSQRILQEEEASKLRQVNDEWHCTLEEAREIEGFRDFLKPKSFHELQKAAHGGPVVMLNASDRGQCDALVITSEGIKHVPLRNITFDDVVTLAQLLRISLSMYPVIPDDLQKSLQALQTRQSQIRKAKRVPDFGKGCEDYLRFILEKLWTLVVHPIVVLLQLKKSDSPPRIWWCPTGPFSFLPIHAAGIYSENGDDSISDYSIFSYTPTLVALLTPYTRLSNDPFKMLVTIQPTTPGQSDLPFTTHELKKIKQHIKKSCLVELGTAESPTSKNKVLSHLLDASIAHFACHGEQNLKNPLKSALLLTDGPLLISRIMEQPLKNALLAFLSACETAVGDETVPDEVIHIAATMLFAGFRGVVGTLWFIDDDAAPTIADFFYGQLFRNNAASELDITEAARALHIAVKELRKEKGCTFRRWVPFIHLGL